MRTRKEVRRKDGTYIRFDQKAAVLIKEDGTRSERAYLGQLLVSCAIKLSEDCLTRAGGYLRDGRNQTLKD